MLCADAFMHHLDAGTFDAHFGEWTVFGGEPPRDPLGFYQDYGAAIRAGYQKYGLESFMVRQIRRDYAIFGKAGAPRILSGLIATVTGRPSHAHPRAIIIR